MKKLYLLILSFLTCLGLTLKVLKPMLPISFFFIIQKVYSQLPPGSMSAGPSTLDSSYTFFRFNSPTNNPGNRWEPLKVGIRETHLRTNRIFIDSLSQYPLSTIPSTGTILWFDNRELHCTPVTKFPLTSSQVTTALGYMPASMSGTVVSNVYYANNGLLKVGSDPNATITINTNSVMTVQRATDSIISLMANINLKANKSTSLSINGTAFDLSSDRSWTILPTTSQVTAAIGYVPLQSEVDGSTTNEIQYLSIAGQTLSISNGNSIVIPTQTTALTLSQVTTALGSTPLFSQTPQALTYSANILILNNGGGSVNITPTLSIGTITTGLGYLPLQSEVDGSISNEIQSLSISGQTISLSLGGGSVVIPTQTTVLTSNQVTTALGYIPLQSEIDGSVTNEIQNLSLSGQSLSISGGNTIVIPTQTVPLTASQVTTALGFNPLSSVPLSSLGISGNTLSIIGSNTIALPQSSIIAGSNMSVSVNNNTFTVINTSPNQTVNISSGTNISISGSYPNYTVNYSAPTRSMSTQSRALVTSTAASGFSISAVSDYNVNYSVYAQVVSVLAGTNTADVYLEISPDNSTWTTISRSGISIAGVVSTSGNTQTVSGFVPKNYFVRIRTASTGVNAGSAVFTYQNGQENSY